jgi:polygalacturonase
MREDCVGRWAPTMTGNITRRRRPVAAALSWWILVAAAVASVGEAQDRRQVTEPTTPSPPYCQVLLANLPALSPNAFTPPRSFADSIENSPPDTARINQAILQCSQVSAQSNFAIPAVVQLAANFSNVSFLSGPILMQSGVTLLVAPGVTLYASRNANEYYLSPPTQSTCGTLDAASSSGCKNWITINSGSSRRAKNISFVGPGTIDGRGDAVITFTDGSGANKNQTLACAPVCTWWDLAHQADLLSTNQNNPRMMQLNDTDNTVLYNINLRNSAKFHVATTRANGFTVWGVSVFSPEGVSRNTDAFDPNGADWTITRSYISVDDDNVAIKGGTVLANNATSASFFTIAHNHFYTGHGMSIGSETNAGVSDIQVTDLTIDGTDNGLRIKSDRSRGGIVQRVSYSDVCMRNIDRRNLGGGALLFSAYYTPNAVGNLFPDYRSVEVHNVHSITPSKQFFVGYDAAHPLNIQLDNVIVDNQDPTEITASDTVITLGPGPVNFTPSGTNVTVFNQISLPQEAPLDCTNRFVPFVAAGVACDTDGNGKIDRNDISAIMAARGFSVFPGDPRDVDHDGVVTILDGRACAVRCTNVQCAP